MKQFYNSIVQSVLTFGFITWFGKLCFGDKLQHIHQVAYKIFSVKLPDLFLT